LIGFPKNDEGIFSETVETKESLQGIEHNKRVTISSHHGVEDEKKNGSLTSYRIISGVTSKN
jgi:hypothetical protein